MIIVCDNCNKKFEIDQKLIPIGGRMLQCGSCNHQWFFKLKKKTEENIREIIKEKKVDEKIRINDFVEETNDRELVNKNEKTIKKQNENNINYFKFILVLIISFIALILTLETFKEHISSVFPNIKIILNNLYQSLEDIKLFIVDLIK